MSSGMSLHLAGDGEREVADAHYFHGRACRLLSLLCKAMLLRCRVAAVAAGWLLCCPAAVERPLCWTTVG